jgi:hypothetical protein
MIFPGAPELHRQALCQDPLPELSPVAGIALTTRRGAVPVEKIFGPLLKPKAILLIF